MPEPVLKIQLRIVCWFILSEAAISATVRSSSDSAIGTKPKRRTPALAGGRRTGRTRGAGYNEPRTRTASGPRMARRRLAGIRIGSL